MEPGRAIAGPSTFTLYEVGTGKEVLLDGDAVRTYVAVDGGNCDNFRPALYDAYYSWTIASRVSDATATTGGRGRWLYWLDRLRQYAPVTGTASRSPARTSEGKNSSLTRISPLSQCLPTTRANVAGASLTRLAIVHE